MLSVRSGNEMSPSLIVIVILLMRFSRQRRRRSCISFAHFLEPAARDLCLIGGIALNCVANARICVTPTTDQFGCHLARPTPALRLAARSGTIIRRSGISGTLS